MAPPRRTSGEEGLEEGFVPNSFLLLVGSLLLLVRHLLLEAMHLFLVASLTREVFLM